MASSSPAIIIPLLLYTLFFSINLISSFQLSDICEHTKNPISCYNFFYNNGTANVQELTQSIIDQTTQNAKATSNKIQILLSQANVDPKLKVVYSLCSNYYGAALSALSAASQKLKSQDFRDVKTAADAVSGDAASCRKTFAMAPSQPINEIADNVASFEVYCDVFVVTAGKL